MTMTPPGPLGSGQGDLAGRSPGAHRRVSSRAVIRTWVVSGVAALGFLVAALAVAGYFRAAFGVQAALLGLLAHSINVGRQARQWTIGGAPFQPI